MAFRKDPFLAPCYLSFILMTSVIPQSCYPFCSLQMIPTSFIHTVIPQYLLHTLNTELHHVAEWIKCNKLSLNLDKTNFMLFSNSLRNLPGHIILDGSTLKRVQSSKFLGVTIDEDLSWKPHVNNECNTVSRNIGMINKLKTLFSTTHIEITILCNSLPLSQLRCTSLGKCK